MTESITAFQTDQMRIKYGFWVVTIGIAIVAAVFITAIVRWSTAAEVTAVVGSVTGVIGTIVSAFFGVQVGSQGKEKAEDRALKAESDRQASEDRVTQLAAALQPDVAAKILRMQL